MQIADVLGQSSLLHLSYAFYWLIFDTGMQKMKCARGAKTPPQHTVERSDLNTSSPLPPLHNFVHDVAVLAGIHCLCVFCLIIPVHQ